MKRDDFSSSRSAFTLLELSVVLAIMIFLSFHAYPIVQDYKFKDDVKDSAVKISQLISEGILNTETGYANGMGGDCSDAIGSFTGMDSLRVNNCADLNQNVYADSVKSGENYYSFIPQWGAFGDGCRAYFKADSIPVQFSLYMDCSSLGVIRRQTYVEKAYPNMIKNALPGAFYASGVESFDLESDTLTKTAENNISDGVFVISFKR